MRRQQEVSLPETTKKQEMNRSLEAVRGPGECRVTQSSPKAEEDLAVSVDLSDALTTAILVPTAMAEEQRMRPSGAAGRCRS